MIAKKAQDRLGTCMCEKSPSSVGGNTTTWWLSVLHRNTFDVLLFDTLNHHMLECVAQKHIRRVKKKKKKKKLPFVTEMSLWLWCIMSERELDENY